MTETNLPPVETNLPPVAMETNMPVVPPAIEPVVPPPASVQEYVIQKGDSFFSIGKKLGVPMKAIQNANPNVNPSKLKIGQKIVIPTVTPPPAAGGMASRNLNPAPPAPGGQQKVVKKGGTKTPQP
jgi:LysM repeat protein